MHIGEQELKKLLVDTDLLDKKTIEKALEEADRTKKDPVDILIGSGDLPEKYFVEILSEYYNIPIINLKSKKIESKILKQIPEGLAKEKHLVCFDEDKDSLLVAFEDPGDIVSLDFIKHYSNKKILPFIATPSDIEETLARYKLGINQEFDKLIEENIKKTGTIDGDIEKIAKDLPIINIFDIIMEYAVVNEATDIHLEPFEDRVMVRYRIDGILEDAISLPKEISEALVARIKILSNLRIDEHRLPQDGRFSYSQHSENFSIRVSIIPTYYGEKAALRLLAGSSKPISLTELGFNAENVKKFKNEITKSNGLILVTGPTGSGKTTTLYAAIHYLNKPQVNISTIEDPIEYDIPRVNQMQVNAQTGLTFASGLRSLVRQNPDIIMVGEIRDNETADIGIHASLTGHLVLSTLHTNDAPSSIPRLLDMGVEPFLLSSTLNLAIAQRLVRRICRNCVTSYKPNTHLMNLAKEQLKRSNPYSNNKITSRFYKGKGCKLCNNTGYHGQIAIYELFQVTDEIKQLITKKSSSSEIKKVALKQGMRTLYEDGLEKVQTGITSIEEVLRVTKE